MRQAPGLPPLDCVVFPILGGQSTKNFAAIIGIKTIKEGEKVG
jgi:hypothetical protein